MPSYVADETALRPPTIPAASFGLSPIDREFIGNSVRHTLAQSSASSFFKPCDRTKETELARPPDLEFRFARSATKFATTDT